MRVHNFSAGPAALPLEILKKAQAELVEYKNTGMSVMEMSHRSSDYIDIFNATESSLRSLMNISEEYEILFLQGGASMQFAQVPMNLMKTKNADYAITGQFAKKAYQEGQKYGNANAICSSEDENFSYIPKDIKVNPNADYLHITTNNTIYGTSYRQNLPETGNVPLVADMSSNILSEVYDVNKFGLIYAGAQKNIGPAGLTIVIIRKDLISDKLESFVPSMLNYSILAKNGSMYNTPPTYSIYVAGLVFDYLLNLGGVSNIQKVNEEKAKLFYEYLDNSKIFTGTAKKENRSIMNVTFVTEDKQTDSDFISYAKTHGIANIKGHRSVGGMRASIYNAVDLESVKWLIEVMKKFELENK